MKFTLKWLQEHIETQADIDKIVNTLNNIGIEVEEVYNQRDEIKQFTVAQIIENHKIENTDNLSCCLVNIKKGENVSVVCGAPNLYDGMKVVYAAPKTYIPGIDKIIEKTRIKGVKSNGMLCSEMEMKISDQHETIIELPQNATVGEKYIKYLDESDTIITLCVSANRGDCFGVNGIARELAAAGIGKLKESKIEKIAPQIKADIKVKISSSNDKDVSCRDVPCRDQPCYAYAGRVIKNVQIKQSPKWLQDRLTNIGLRPVNAVVDVTNFITFDRARPLHAFDLDKIDGNINVKYPEKEHKINALDNQQYLVKTSDCVIADDNNILALAGVIGNKESSVTQETKNIFIESALFNPDVVAKTARRLGIVSDARQRFERGVDPNSIIDGIELATKLITDICGGKPAQVIEQNNIQKQQKKITFPYHEIKRLTNLDIEIDTVNLILDKLGFVIEKYDQIECLVIVPSYRFDVSHKADLVEEVMRIYGVDKIKKQPLPNIPVVPKPQLTQIQTQIIKTRRIAAARGLIEIVSWSMIPEDIAQKFYQKQINIIIKNPISKELAAMRQNLLVGLLNAVAKNERHGHRDFGLFEIGSCFHGFEPSQQSNQIAIVRTGTASFATAGRHWQHETKDINPFELKNDAQMILVALGYKQKSIKIIPDDTGWYQPGYSGKITIGGKNIVGKFGMIDIKVRQYFGIKQKIAACELYLSQLPQRKINLKTYKKPIGEKMTKIVRDLAFVMKNEENAEQIISTIWRAGKNLIADVRLFDLYQHQAQHQQTQIKKGEKSLAFEITIQTYDHNPTEEWIKGIINKIITDVEKYCEARLRT